MFNKTTITFLLICFFQSKSFAQSDFYLSLYAGANTSQVSGDDTFGFNKFGAYLGLGTGQEISDNLSWEFALMLSQKGSYNTSSANTSFKYLLNLTYIDIPISLRYQTPIEKISLEAGPTISVLVSFRENNIQGNVNDPREFKRYEVGAFLGAIYQLNDRTGIIARFSNSILPIREHLSGKTFRYNRGQYNTYISAALRIQF